MRTAEQFFIDMGSYRITVTRKRVKNVNFRIGTSGEALMSIPMHVSRADAERIAHEHASWFEQALARSASRKAEVPVTWTTGEMLNVWGTPTKLRVVGRAETQVPCELKDGPGPHPHQHRPGRVPAGVHRGRPRPRALPPAREQPRQPVQGAHGPLLS